MAQKMTPTEARTILDPNEQLAEKLRIIIRDSGLSVSSLAHLTGIPKSTLARQITSGDLWVSAFVRICAVLRIPPATLLGEPDASVIAEARRMAELLAGLSVAERHALVSIVRSAVELRTAAVVADRAHATTGTLLDGLATSPDDTPTHGFAVPRRRHDD